MVETEGQKQEIRQFWGNRPCGVIGSAHPTDSSAFYAETRGKRFVIHTDLDRLFSKKQSVFRSTPGRRCWKSVVESVSTPSSGSSQE